MEPGLLIFSYFFCVVLLCVYVLSSCCDVRYYFLLKRYPVRLYLKLFLVCSRGHILLSTCVCLLTYCGVKHILCCVFVLFFFILCNLCCQFLWMSILNCPSAFSNVYVEQLKKGKKEEKNSK